MSSSEIYKESSDRTSHDEKVELIGSIFGPKFENLLHKINNIFSFFSGKEVAATDEDNKDRDTISANSLEPSLSKKSEHVTKGAVILDDMTSLRSQYPREAWSKCNNPAGITWNGNFEHPKKGTLAYDLQQAGVQFYEDQTGRGPGEGGNYVGFNTMDDGLKALVLLWDRSAKQGKSIEKRLSNYAASPYKIPGIDASMKFSELTSEQKNDLLMKQVQLESGGLYNELRDRNIDFKTLHLV